jgi:hypothetical protein
MMAIDRAYHGKGTLRSKAGDQFEGEFERGMMRQGKGKMVLEEGFIYEGEIFDGAPSGYGKQYHPSTHPLPECVLCVSCVCVPRA